VALTGPAPSLDLEASTAATLHGDAPDAALEELGRALAPFGPRLEQLADGTVVATLAGVGAATDQAAGAARCALGLRETLPDRAIALATGRGVIAGSLPIGEVIDRAARMLSAHCAGSIRVDELTAGLLDPRFVVGGDERGLALFGERDLAEASRSLLGRQSPCVGRDAELGHLRATLADAAARGGARALLVTAPAGAGKSRLRRELVEGLGRDGGARPTVLSGHGDPGSAGSPFGMLAPALRRAAGVLDGEQPVVRRQKIRAWATRHLAPGDDAARVAEFLGELCGVPFPDDDRVQLRAARRDAVLMGDQMRRAFEDFVAAECAAGPVLIVLDDLHWGDRPSLGFVGAALRALPRAPLVVLALARPEVHELFPALWAEHGVEVLALRPLPLADSMELVRHALGPGDDVAAVLADRAEGNAFYLEELIRHVARLGVASSAEALPQTVLAMVEARLAALDPEARRVLRAASVFGPVFTRDGVVALLGEDEAAARVTEQLAALEARELVVRRPASRFPGDAEHAFHHALLRDAAYAMLTAADRALGHRLAGAWLEAAGEGHAAVLAEHFERGGEPERAAGFYRRAAAQALEGNDFDGAVALAERGIAVIPKQAGRGFGAVRLGGARPMELGTGPALGGSPGELGGALRALEATAHRWRGRNAEALRCGLEATAQLPRRSAGWYAAAAEIAIAAMKLGDTHRLEEIGETLAELAESGEQGADHAIACARAATQLLYGGRRGIADALFACLDRAAGPAAGDPAVEARREQALAIRALYDGDLEEHVARMDASARAFEAAGDLRNASAQRVNTMFAKLEVGAYEEVERDMRDAIAGAERLGLAAFAALARCNLGMARRALGALDDARAIEAEAATAFAAQGDRRMEGVSRNNLAIILTDAGDLAGAEREARAAIEILATNGPARAYALATLARVQLERGESAPALATAREAALAALGGIEEGESAVMLVHAEALAAAGDRAGALLAIARARTRLGARAQRIADPARRASFLRRVPDNARTLELARAWTGEG
jgi:tetratricopeptide (TPR) repeat protein